MKQWSGIRFFRIIIIYMKSRFLNYKDMRSLMIANEQLQQRVRELEQRSTTVDLLRTSLE